MSRLRAAGPSAARTRARWAFWTLIGINALMLWFFLGMSASLNWHAKVLEEDTLQMCSTSALQRESVSAYTTEFDNARFVGDATIRFTGEFDGYDDDRREVTESIEVECTVGVADEDSGSSDSLVVRRAEVVR